ncbi:MAG: hypothetical protein A2X49_06485 [Lentisphaerae bacterium GWF2_52_8]|nr:MAG: hypothetical protein A2X49_06485 [Lentisphaerae bacterium GWF2_52_8]
MKKFIIFLFLTLMLLHSGCALNVIRNGKICIVPAIGDKALAPEKFAADEFNRTLQKMANSIPQEKSKPSSRLVIGTPATNPEIAEKAEELGLQREELKKRDSFILKTIGADIYAASNYPSGAMFAVFDLMERLGIRWFFPSEAGEFVPQTANLSIDKLNIISAPDFEFRVLGAHYKHDKYVFLQHCKLTAPSPDPKKYGHDGFYKNWGGHSFNWFFPPDCKTVEEYFKKYPEQFAWDKRNKTPVISQHCYSNPDTKKTFLDWIDNFWTKNPDYNSLALVPRDSPVSCQCEGCLKLDPSTLTHKFIAGLIRESEKKHPGKMYQTLAYSFYTTPPQCELPQNQIFSYCMINCCYKHKIDDPICVRNPKHIEELAAWQKKLQCVGSYGYEFIAFKDNSIYTPITPVIASELRQYKKMGLVRFATENYQHFNPSEPWEEQSSFVNRYPIYATTRLSWNTSIEPESILRDFCKYSYGSASSEMEEYHKLMEDAWQKGDAQLCGYNKNYKNYADGFITAELIEKIDRLFSTALEKTKNEARANKFIVLDQKAWQNWRNIGQRYLELHTRLDTGSAPLEELRKRPAESILYKPDLNLPEFKDFADLKEKEDKFPNVEEPPLMLPHPQMEEGCMVGSVIENGEAYQFISVRTKESIFLFKNPEILFKNSFEQCNYEISFRFRFPENSGKNPWFDTSLRHAGLRLAQKFIDNIITINTHYVTIKTRSRDREPSPTALPEKLTAKILPPLEKGKWYPVRIRAVDKWIFVEINGKEIATYGPIFGGGYANLFSPNTEIRDFIIKEIK